MEGANGTHLTHWGLWIVVDNESSKCGWKKKQRQMKMSGNRCNRDMGEDLDLFG